MTHDELASDLASHLRGSGDWMTWEDIPMGSGGSQRPDVLAIGRTFSRLDVRVYEVKVSRSDFRADVTAGKWQGYLKVAGAVIFAFDHNLDVRKTEIPDGCGLIVRGESGQWRHVKRPTLRTQSEMPWTLWLKLLMDGVAREGGAVRARDFSNYLAQRKLAKRFGETAAQQLADLEGLPQRLEWAISNHESAIKSLNDSHARRVEDIRSRQELEKDLLDDSLRELATTFGVETSGDIRMRAREIVLAVRQDTRLQNTLTSLDRQIAALTHARQQLQLN